MRMERTIFNREWTPMYANDVGRMALEALGSRLRDFGCHRMVRGAVPIANASAVSSVAEEENHDR
jgi:hypothetical protein